MKQKSNSYFHRILITALAVLLVSVLCVVGFAANGSFESAPVAQECYVLGDMDSNGEITSRDAIHLLYNIYWPEEYPIHGDGDLNNDETHDAKDALALLYAVSFPEDEELKLTEIVHAYGEPLLIWEENGNGGYSARCVTDCACHEAPVTKDAVVEVVESETKDPTCMDQGSLTWTASVEGVDLDAATATKEKSIPATGHDMIAADCDTPRHCKNCEYKEGDVLGHRWELTSTIPATCQAEGKEIYKCTAANCQGAMEITLNTADHTWVRDDGDPTEVQIEKCTYQTNVSYHCSVDGCDETKVVPTEQTYVKHVYGDAVLTKPATCVAEGVRTFTCTACGDAKVETVAKNPDAHTWVAAASAEEITTHTCANEGCEATKTTVVVASKQPVSTETLKNELQLTSENAETGETVNAALTVDEATLNALDSEKEVKVSVDKASQEDIQELLSAEQKDQLGENPVVYDFNMAYAAASEEDEDEAITEFGGEVTITLPYTLEEGEDPENIAVWFIPDNGGEIQSIPATYSNGFVTFKTKHFSYYTVTRLTPAERCATYGHLELVVKEKTATCTEDGYYVETCPRCGENVVDEHYTHTGHQYVTYKQDADCENGGEITKTCSACEHNIKVTLPAMGHNMQVDESVSKEPTCMEAGKLVYSCVNGCGREIVEEKPATGHDFELTAEEKADCTNNGHKDYECKNGCGEKFSEITEGFTGHLYNDENAVWDWDVDANGKITNVTCTLRCAYNLENENHWHELKKITVTSESEGMTCTEDGTVKYTFKASYNAKTTFTKEVEVVAPALGHIPATEWQHDDFIHFKECSRCGERVTQAQHIMIDDEIITEATCVDSGEVSIVCFECGYEDTRELPATNVHDYDEHGICRVCGKSETDCNHCRVIEEEIDLSGYNVCEGTRAVWISCECGYDRELKVWTDGCDENYTAPAMISPDGVTMDLNVKTCENCDLVVYSSEYFTYEEENCKTNTVYYCKAVVNDTVLGESYAESEYGFSNHYLSESRLIQLTMEEHGVCDATYAVESCGCGENVRGGLLSGGCDLEYVEDTAAGTVYRCRICGSERLETSIQFTQNGCYEEYEYTVTISKDGQEILTLDTNGINTHHLYRMVNAETYNGYWIVDVECVFCGIEDQRVQAGCGESCMYVTEYTLVDSLCCAAIVQQTCPCGEHGVELTEWNIVDFSCFWRSDETGTVFTCANCGARKEVSTQWQETENPCIMGARTDYIFYDADGNEVANGYSISEHVNHNYVTEYTLMGDYCDDGVLVTEICTGCGDGRSYTYYGHDAYLVETYDFSQWDVCFDSMSQYSCLCGMSAYISQNSEENNSCEWNWVEMEGALDAYVCVKCGVVEAWNNEIIGNKDACHRIKQYSVTHYDGIGGEVLNTITYEWVEEVHDEYFVFDLLDGATTCNDGYDVTLYCFNCDYEEYWGVWYGCDVRRVNRETYPVEGMCGTPVLDTFSCACGANVSYERKWDSEECYVPNMSYNDVTGRDEGICENCGVMHTCRYSKADNEEDSCSYFELWEYTFERNGQVLAEIPLKYNAEQHSYNTAFTMLGDTCDDGYYAESTCQQCGDVYTNYYEGCDHYIERETEIVYDQVGMCGKIQYSSLGCACKTSRVALDWRCNNYYSHDTDDGYRVEKCRDCGLELHYQYKDTDVPGTCLYNREETDIFYRNGQKVAEKTFSYQNNNHQMVYAFDMYGDTCEDGYLVTGKCHFCEYTEEWESCDCTDWCTEYKVLADSDIACGRFHYFHVESPCGKTDYWGHNYACNFNYLGNEDGWYIYECTECGLVWKERTTDERGNTCKHASIREIEILKNGEVISSEVIRDHYFEHIPVVDAFHMNGEACADGYTVTGDCIFCHEPVIDETVYYECQWFPTEVHLLADEEGTCGLNAYVDGNCPCGSSPFTLPAFSCRFQEIESNEDGTVVYLACNVCGLEAVQEKLEDTVDGCVTTQHYRYTMSKDGQVFNEIEVPFEITNHEYVYELEVLGNTCNDGYYATGTCRFCGEETAPVKGYGCTKYLVDYYEFEHEGSCGTYTLRIENCACGDNGNGFRITEELPCEMELIYSEYGNTSSVEYLKCTKCGRQLNVSSTLGVLDDACTLGVRYTGQWIWNGESAGEFVFEAAALKDHKLIYEFDMLGDSLFEDGCAIYAHCAECGMELGYQETTYTYMPYPVDYVPLSDNLYTCGNHRFGYYEFAFPNGDPAGPNLTCACTNWTTITTTGGTTVQQCTNCGLQWVGTVTEERIPGTCTLAVRIDADYGFNYTDGSGFEVDLGSVHDNFEVTFHQEIFSFNLFGDSCEDGYEVYDECAFCDIRMKIPGEYYGHSTWATAAYDLAAMGVCLDSNGGAWAIQVNCPCGKNAYIDIVTGCYTEEDSYNRVELDNGQIVESVVMHCTSEECTTAGQEIQAIYTPPAAGSCTATLKITITITFDDGSTVEFYQNEEHINHTGEITNSYTFLNGGTTCEDGVTEFQTCSNCQETTEVGTVYYCKTHQVSQSNMSDYGVECGGYMVYSACPCGNLTYYETVENGCSVSSVEIDPFVSDMVENGHYQTEDGEILVQNYAYESVCTNPDCGVHTRSCNYWVKEGCELVNYEILQLGYDEATGEYLGEFTSRLNSHDYHDPDSQEEHREFLEESNACYEGVNVQVICSDCDEVLDEWGYSGCEYTFPTEKIDLSQYGSLCGGYLAKYECLCGEAIPYYDFLDLKCDLDQVETEHFVEGTLDEVGQEVTIGWNWLDSESYILTCAVTHPEICGMKIRQSRCWLQEGCYAVEYYVFQLDYDPDTDTWAKEIRFPTGNKQTFHPVEQYFYQEDLEGTDYMYVEGYTCSDCGSSYEQKSYYTYNAEINAFHNAKNERLFVNKLDNGEDKRNYVYWESDVFHEHIYSTFERNERTFADGSEYWAQWENEYDFSDGCKGICYFTNSQGYSTTSEFDAHYNMYSEHYDPAPTCGQFGLWVYEDICDICGQITRSNGQIVEPTGHDWFWNEEYGIYECTICQMECVNDASGSIVLEDLSEELGNGTDYVVAYWNRGNIDYSRYICVVLNDMDGDNERFLTINYADEPLDEFGSNAIRFNIAEAEAAAAQIVAQEGYTGDYSIRLTFAPTDIEGELDYSVTFDTLKAE